MNRILRVDVGNAQVTEQPVPPQYEGLEKLYEQYKDREPLILGSGFFTARISPWG